MYSYRLVRDAVLSLTTAARHKPYKYGGKWFIAQVGEKAYAARSIKTIHGRAIKAGMDSVEVTILNSK